jgi:competence protein ComEC
MTSLKHIFARVAFDNSCLLLAMTSRSLGHRAPLLWLALPLVAGLITARIVHVAPLALELGVAAVAAGLAVWVAWKNQRGWEFAIATAMFLAGAGNYDLARARIAAWDTLPAREIELSLQIERVFSRADPKKTAGLARIIQASERYHDLVGQHVYFSAILRPPDPVPSRSATIVMVGVITPLPRNPPSDSFDSYLASSGINFRLNRARCVTEQRPQLAYYRFCDEAADRFNVLLGVGIADKRPTLAGLLRAMMLGETRELTEEQHTIFMQSGTMHLFAISGLNIAVISAAVQALLGLCRISPWARFAIGTPLLWLFVDITGAAPSAVRAFAMATFFHGAFVLRRPANPIAALVGSALLVLLWQPLQLFSASFLMSYGIVLALLLLGLPLGEAWLQAWTPGRFLPMMAWTWWQRVVDEVWRWIAPTIAIGVATASVSMLTGVEYFRLLTPGSLLANLVLIPAAMIVTLGGFAALVCGLIGFTAGVVMCNHASALVLLVIEALVRESVRMPWAFIPAEFKAGWVGGTALATTLIAMLVGYSWQWRRERGGWWPPFAIVAVVLLFGVKFS